MSDRELTVVKGQVGKVLGAALTVESAEQYTEATELLGRIKKAVAFVKGETEKITRPLLDALNAERARWKPMLAEAEAAESAVKSKMLAWYSAEQERSRKEAAALEAKVAAGKMSPEKALAKAESIVQPERAVAGTGVVAEIRKVRKMYITDEKLVPDEYWIINEVLLRKDALAGKEIPGVEVRTENSIAGTLV